MDTRTFLLHDPISNVVRLGGASEPVARTGAIMRGPVADKFFAVSAVATFFGATWLGAHLWMMLNGKMAVSPSFVEIRRFHIYLQLYLFFGLAIIGFLIQAAPRFLQVAVRPNPRALLLVPLLVVTALLAALLPGNRLAQCALSLPFVAVGVGMMQLLKAAPAGPRWQFGTWIGLSLAGFIVGAFFDGEGADRWLTTFWLGVAPMVIGVGQQFIRAFVTGRSLEGKWPIGLGVGASVSLLLAYLRGDEWLWQLTGVVTAALNLGYVWQLRLWSRAAWKSHGVLSVAFAVGYMWACAGAVVLALRGVVAADAVLHAWALGWVCTLLFAISAQILENISGGFLIGERWRLPFIAVWQLVPLGRAGFAVVALPAWMSLVVAWVATGAFVVWGLGAVLAARRIWREQRKPVAERA